MLLDFIFKMTFYLNISILGFHIYHLNMTQPPSRVAISGKDI